LSKKNSSWQNGEQESFYQKFKFELEDFNSYPSQGELIEAYLASNSLSQSQTHPQRFKDAANNLLPKI